MNEATVLEVDTLYQAMFEKSDVTTDEIVARVALVFPLLVDDWRGMRQRQTVDFDGLYRDAIEIYGIDAQMNLLQEECGELVVAISHYRRGRVTLEKVAEELADVMIVARQITLGIGPLSVNRWIREKVTRLMVKLAKHTPGDV